jgi:hypothetical protein
MTNITLEIPEQWEDLLSLAIERGRRIPLELGALDWDGFVKEMTENYPDLAKRLLSDSGWLASGIAIAVNDEMFGSNGIPKAISFEQGDVVSIIIPFAGG